MYQGSAFLRMLERKIDAILDFAFFFLVPFFFWQWLHEHTLRDFFTSQKQKHIFLLHLLLNVFIALSGCVGIYICFCKQYKLLFYVFSPSCRRNKDKKENAAEAEADPERDQRTVFAYQVLMHLECLFYHVIVALIFFLMTADVKFCNQFLTDIFEG